VNDLRIKDVGTAFNVRDAGSRTVVTVIDGAVDVSSTAPSSRDVRLTAGEEVRWDRQAPPIVAKADTTRALAWREGRLEYVDQPLSSVIADVNRYARHPVVIRDKAVGEIPFTGTVFTRSADEWVQSLPNEFPVELISAGGTSLVLASRPGADGSPPAR
jgi:transmembrane sensor